MMVCHQRCLEQDMPQQLPSAASWAPAAQGTAVVRDGRDPRYRAQNLGGPGQFRM